MNRRKKLAILSVLCHGDWDLIAKALKQKYEPVDINIKDSYITIYDDNYPNVLRKLRYPPWVIFYQGDISLLEKPMITIIGTRKMDAYAASLSEYTVRELCQRFVIVSGLAKGVDGCVHRHAIKMGHTIGIIGSGLDICYPKENFDLYRRMRQTELILSEYPAGTGIRKHHFPWRNRLLAALGQNLIVIAAKIKSGTMCTVNEAIELNKEIFVFPHPFMAAQGIGCNKLIADGAEILYDAVQLKEMMPKKDD